MGNGTSNVDGRTTENTRVDPTQYVIGDEEGGGDGFVKLQNRQQQEGGGEEEGQRDRSVFDSHDQVTKTPPRGLWWNQAALLLIACLLVLSAGFRCATDEECSLLAHPSLGNFLNNTDTSAIAITAVNTLVAAHYLQMVATYHMVRSHSGYAAPLLILVSAVLYVSLFAAFLYPLWWYVAVLPIGASVALFAIALHGLRRYHAYKPARQRILFYASCALFVVYVLASLFYLVFSAIPSPVQARDFAGKQQGVFAAELTMLISGVMFMGLLAFFTRRVSYIFEVQRTVEAYIVV